MKTIIIIAFVLLASLRVKAQAFRTYADTANYLIGQVENKKSQYIGKPFSVLYDSLKIKPVRVIPDYTDINPNNKENFGRDLCFYFNYERTFEKTHFLVIIWNSSPPYNAVYPMFYPIENKAPIGDIINLYKPLIVKNIILKDYQQDDPVDPNVILQQE